MVASHRVDGSKIHVLPQSRTLKLQSTHRYSLAFEEVLREAASEDVSRMLSCETYSSCETGGLQGGRSSPDARGSRALDLCNDALRALLMESVTLGSL